jgi:hypothetical protein
VNALAENVIGVILVVLGLIAMGGSAYFKDESLKNAGFGLLSAGLTAIKAPTLAKDQKA